MFGSAQVPGIGKRQRMKNLIRNCIAAREIAKASQILNLRRPGRSLNSKKVRVSKTCYEDLSGGAETPSMAPHSVPLRSALCRQSDFMRDGYRYWTSAFGEPPRLHRKQWEFYFIVQALYERGMLEPGKRALGFGVGQEPLPALFASRGAGVVASDQGFEGAVRGGWAQTGQHTTSNVKLNDRGICPEEEFSKHVRFREVDMNQIPSDMDGQFDACWSACCLEHLGSLQCGLDFIVNSINTLRPGGVAVHTTEFNLTSNDQTIETRDLSLYRKRDIEALIVRLEANGHRVEPIDWSTGTGYVDGYIDLPPYKVEPHLKLKIGAYECTSIALIITKGGA